MKKILWAFIVACLGLAGTPPLGAQQPPMQLSPPKTLVIIQEKVKLDKIGMPHERTEAQYVRAFERERWPVHYVAATSVTGSAQAWFFIGYDSFADWQKDQDHVNGNPAISAELAQLDREDAANLLGKRQLVAAYRDDLSYNPTVPADGIHYLEVLTVHVRPGHEWEYEEYVRMVLNADQKAESPEHWASYQVVSGDDFDTYLVFSPRKSPAEWDNFGKFAKAFEQALGKDRDKLTKLQANSVIKGSSRLFVFSPVMSYVPEAWAAADPEFWRPEAAVVRRPVHGKRPARKPEQKR
jgi:hypothetical protein